MKLDPIAAQKLAQIQRHIQKHPELRRIRCSTTARLTGSDICSATAGQWTLLAKPMVRPFLKNLFADHQRPMPEGELLNKIISKNVAFITSDQRRYLIEFLQSSKYAFIKLRHAGYWPAELPYAGHIGSIVDRHSTLRATGLKTRKAVEEVASGNREIPLTSWLSIKKRVSTVEFCLRKHNLHEKCELSTKLHLAIPDNEGEFKTEKWLFLGRRLAARCARREMLRVGHPMFGDDVLKELISANIGLQSYEQRRCMTELLRYYRGRGVLIHVPDHGYWPAEVPVGYDGGGRAVVASGCHGG
jgi:hypothetical protein